MDLITALKMAPWIAILGLLVALGITKGEVRHWRSNAEHCATARSADRESYASAQREAAALNQAHVAKVEAEQRKITEEVSNDYEADLARLRAASRLRSPTPAAPGAPGGAGKPKVVPAAPGVDGADKLPLPAEELLSAQEIELQLMHLQDWVRGQLGVVR